MEKKSRRKITYAAEDYLKAIYFLQMQNDNVRVTDLADKLSVSKPSVTRAVNKLKQIRDMDDPELVFGSCILLDDEDTALDIFSRFQDERKLWFVKTNGKRFFICRKYCYAP